MDVRATRITGLEQLWATRARSTEPSREPSAAPAPAGTRVRISPEAGLLQQMSLLQQQDPERFKEVLGTASQNLTAASQNPAAGDVNRDLDEVARSLARVARSGDLARLEAPTALNVQNRAIEAYLKNARQPLPPSDTSREALRYVLGMLADAQRDVRPASGARAALQ